MREERIVVASEEPGGLDARVSHHFGRATHFTVVRVEDGRIRGHEVVANPHAENHRPGVVPKLVRDLRPDLVVAGGMGERARAVFDTTGIAVLDGISGRVADVVEKLLGDERASLEQENGAAHRRHAMHHRHRAHVRRHGHT